MASPVTHSAMLAALAVAITAIDATPFQHGSMDEDFHEALAPFGPEDQGDAISHLGFAAFLRGSTPTDSRQQAGSDIEVESLVDVYLGFRIRPPSQVADYRLALDASEAIIRAVIDTSWMHEASAVCTEAAEVRQILNEPWLVVRVGFLITYEIGG